MNKLIKLFTLVCFMFCLSGCFKEDVLSNDNVYTTIYPIKYLTDVLYGDTKTIASIYPNGANVSKYELTKKQKEVYSLGSLFVYNGITTEKELAREFLKKNKNILLIDASYNLKYDTDIEELWLSPNNYLMLAKNIKNNLIEYTTSKVTKESIEKNFKDLEERLSYMDADLRSIATSAANEGSTLIVTSSSKLNFLKKYGFEVLNLSNSSINENTIKSNFKNENYKDIYLCSTDQKTALITDLETNYGANVIIVNTMETLTDNEVANKENYETIMNNFIENIRNTTLS